MTIKSKNIKIFPIRTLEIGSISLPWPLSSQTYCMYTVSYIYIFLREALALIIKGLGIYHNKNLYYKNVAHADNVAMGALPTCAAAAIL